jgi:hypothetical protein
LTQTCAVLLAFVVVDGCVPLKESESEGKGKNSHVYAFPNGTVLAEQ